MTRGGPSYSFKWLPGRMIDAATREELAHLYSHHYGIWSDNAKKPFQPIRLSANRIGDWLNHSETHVAYAVVNGKIIGYAIAVLPRVPRIGAVAWVTQLVVHEDHRKKDVAKHLLFSIWGFSNHYAWGLVTANPYAVRALEKATRRRCEPIRIAKDARALLKIGASVIPYVSEDTEHIVQDGESRIDTAFPIDHSLLPLMLSDVTRPDTPWRLGEIPEGWEWFAFTFNDQQEMDLSAEEIEKMLQTSDQVAKQAYSRMRLKGSHRWAAYTHAEIDLVISECLLTAQSKVLDLGCGTGRHVTELARRGISATGVDYLEEAIEKLRGEARSDSCASFAAGDARTLNLRETFDAVLCLYDVIGSYADADENAQILRTIRRHLRPGGRVMISVMNLDLTINRALHRFRLSKEPNRLLDLEPSATMESTGDVFDPRYYLVDEAEGVVYRKEQFKEGEELPVELLVRDRRYRRRDIEAICMNAGLSVLWSRFVRAGHWDEELDRDDDHAKEILLLCEYPA